MPTQTIERDTTLEEAQRTAGVEAPPQLQLEDYLNSVFSQGVLSAVHISRISWMQRLTPQDYGLDELPKNQKAGHRILLEGPVVEELAKYEGATRYWLQKVSLRFPVELIRFVPKSKVGAVLAEFDVRKAGYSQLVEELIARYPQLQDAARERYPDQWMKMAHAYPSVDKIRAGHSMKLEMFEYAFPRAFSSTKTSLDQAAVDQEYRQKQERMVQQQQEQTRQTMTRFVDDTIRDLRGRVVERFQEVITNARNGQVVAGRTVNSLRMLLAEVREMDFVGDRQFQAQLSAVEEQLAGADGRTFQDSASAMRALDSAMNNVIDYARNTTDGTVKSMTAGFMTGKRRLAL